MDPHCHEQRFSKVHPLSHHACAREYHDVHLGRNATINDIMRRLTARYSSEPRHWNEAHATFYGNSDATGTMDGACRYGNLYSQGYGTNTAALGTVLFKNGAACGGCYEIKCWNDTQWCNPGNPSVFITPTKLCPPNDAFPNDSGGWCNIPREHFDMSQPAFSQISFWLAGIVLVLYRRVPWHMDGGMRFTINGNPWFYLVLVSNVGGMGDISAVSVRGSETGCFDTDYPQCCPFKLAVWSNLQ
ncbi:hypothetical protein O6H91_01G150900 [Diphasiastrum complanatum]|uniref:Uncharacterized protein n=1 Tax=Diphasiastrum complanatum TaxID=34168 RepID=A0ACC2EXB2_DIPCM|nr:hypothetical protein O6H91_01G150900 [Diphasiastrum complanatum]